MTLFKWRRNLLGNYLTSVFRLKNLVTFAFKFVNYKNSCETSIFFFLKHFKLKIISLLLYHQLFDFVSDSDFYIMNIYLRLMQKIIIKLYVYY